MADKEHMFIDLTWIQTGDADPHPDLATTKPEDLMLADHTHDQLANLVFLIGDRSKEEDMSLMLKAHRTGGNHISMIAALTAAKERIRWLARRVAILEGRYPGITVEPPKPLEEIVVDSPEVVAEAMLEMHLPFFKEVLGLAPDVTMNQMSGHSAHYLGLNPTKIHVVLGHTMKTQYVKRWHIYVELVRTLLKNNGIYVPFIDDIWTDNFELHGVVFISRSKYFGSGTHRLKRHTKKVVKYAYGKDAVELKAREIYDAWPNRQELTDWVVSGDTAWQNKAREEARELLNKEMEELNNDK